MATCILCDEVSPALSPGGSSPAAEGPANLLGGSHETKWLQFINPVRMKAELVFELGASTPVTSYQFSTANDFNERDPMSWDIYYRQRGGEWTLADKVTKSWVASKNSVHGILARCRMATHPGSDLHPTHARRWERWTPRCRKATRLTARYQQRHSQRFG